MRLLQTFARKKRIKLILPYLEKTDRILDIGCGDGFLSASLSSHNITGIDISGHCDIKCEVLEHVDCLAEIKHTLKPDGLLIITIPNPHTEFILNVLIFFKLTGENITPHINKIQCKDIDMQLINYRKLFMNMSEFGVFQKYGIQKT